MTLWIVMTIMTTLAALALAIPVIRRLEAPKTEQERFLQFSREQLAEIDTEQARGALSEADAAEARAEVERRVLAAAKSAPAPLRPTSNATRAWALAAVTGWVVAGATGLYAILGRPDLAASPAMVTAQAAAPTVTAPATEGMMPAETTAAAAAAPAAAGTGSVEAGSVEEAINKLITRLQEKPDDAEGWRMLGWSYFNTERYAEASEAYAKAVKLDGSMPEVWSAYGETLVRSARGMVTEEALAAFDEALKIKPDDPRARFFKGMALEQAGNPTGAIESWLELAKSAPAGADWLPGVVTRIDELAAATNYDLKGQLDPMRTAVAALPPTGTLGTAQPTTTDRGPTAADVAAAGNMTPQDRQAMIQGMVAQLAARLADNPDDPEGWVKLIRSQVVMKDPEAAAAAYQDAKAALASMPDKLAIVTEGARAAGLSVD